MSAAVGPAAAEPARGLRPSGTATDTADDGGPSRVLRIDPPDGAQGVFRDARVVACLSRPADAASVSTETFVVVDEQGAVPGDVWTSLDGTVLAWIPRRLLFAGALHSVRLAGLRDRHGRDLKLHESVFVPCDLSLSDLSP